MDPFTAPDPRRRGTTYPVPAGGDAMRYRTTVLQGDKTATGIEVPEEVVTALGAGKRPPVRVTINGYTYRSTVAVYGDEYLVGVSAENRAGARVAAGEAIDVDLELDTEKREVDVPPDLAAALSTEPEARRFYDGLSYSKRQAIVLSIQGAKAPETRLRRVEKAVSALRQGRS